MSELGTGIAEWDIDTAHRVPLRNQNGRRRQASVNQPIICKFTRRIARERVLSKAQRYSFAEAREQRTTGRK